MQGMLRGLVEEDNAYETTHLNPARLKTDRKRVP